ncbi:hypothetical protein [Pseudomonas aeruginosa]|uniref:hypothetical protein n=1 Tax=Pseudomonas aeruginosa TaxID=287 RepID=UPI0004EF9C6D|nr:hypothetical protein [Pseudomonas aeruginosa]MBG4023953.1 hypothetical protein [Pseudomonas aeruginosa]MBG5399428.1 hypothetical protein [Pseudomonas aeruginosa]MBG6483309.1 hypothetical protein [Pseudomonas aeruginosa]MBH3759450.1 hypothetical protein [Pseudomonas aeruginosa]MBH4350329.1 hypothetical protein [Pseudomonas aeruginosa]
MDSISPNTWFPVATLVTGILLKALFDALSERRKASIEREARLERRKEMILLQRIEQQRKYLEALQETAADLARCCGLVNLQDYISSRKSEPWGQARLEESLDEKFRICQRQMTLYSVRVQAEEVREKADAFSSLATEVSQANSENESNQKLYEVSIAFEDLNAVIGVSLRTLESDEQALLN